MREKLAPRRFLSVALIFVFMIVTELFLTLIYGFYLDEIAIIGFVTLIFVLLLIFEIVSERAHGQIAGNNKTSYGKLTAAVFVCCLIEIASSFLPLYCRPLAVITLILCFYGNEFIGLICSLFFSLLMCMAVSGEYYEFVTYVMLSLAAAIIVKAIKNKNKPVFLYLLLLCTNGMIPCIFYYWATKEYDVKILLAGFICGLAGVLVCICCNRNYKDHLENEIDDILVDIITEDYSYAAELKKFSKAEYQHSNRVSVLAFKAAQLVGLNPKLCAAGGFYYRIGKWEGKPYIQNGIKKAESLCFPEALINIISEYYGKDKLPSTPESALVHMVDSVVVKLEQIKNDVSYNSWNNEMIVMQTLNEYSASGLYDKSGLSMNQFLKIRDFLSKEEMLR